MNDINGVSLTDNCYVRTTKNGELSVAKVYEKDFLFYSNIHNCRFSDEGCLLDEDKISHYGVAVIKDKKVLERLYRINADSCTFGSRKSSVDKLKVSWFSIDSKREDEYGGFTYGKGYEDHCK